MALKDFLREWKVHRDSNAPGDGAGTVCFYADVVNRRKSKDVLGPISDCSDEGRKVIIRYAGFGRQYPSVQNAHYLEDGAPGGTVVAVSRRRKIVFSVDSGVLEASVTEKWSADENR